MALSKKRRIFWFGIVPALCVLFVAATPQCRWGLIGLYKGESFYACLPTSYWRQAIQEWPTSERSSNRFSFLPAKIRWYLKIDNERPLPPLYQRWEKSVGSWKAARAAVPVLIELLEDSDRHICLYAIGVIRELGHDARNAVPALVAKLKQTPDATIRKQVAWTLGVVAPDDQERVQPALRVALKDEDQVVRANAAWSLKQSESAGQQVRK